MRQHRPRIVTSLVRQIINGELHRQDGWSDLEDGLLQTHDFVEVLRESRSAAFERTKEGSMVSTGAFDGFFELLRHPLRPEYLAHFELSPQINAFVQVCAMLKIPARFWESPSRPQELGAKSIGESFNDAITLIRERAAMRALDKRFDSRRATALENCQSAGTLIHKASATLRHPYVCRFDLVYGAHARSTLTAGGVKRDVADLLNGWRKHRLHSAVTACLWILQYGKISGHHVHFTVIAEAVVMGDQTLWFADLESIWKRIAGPSSSLRVYGQADGVLGWAAGLWTDKSLQCEQLQSSWSYLLQREMYYRVKVAPHARTFGKSEKPIVAKKSPDLEGSRRISIQKARQLLTSLKQTKGSIPVAVRASKLPYTPSLQQQLSGWKRMRIHTHVVIEDFSDTELRKLLFSRNRGKFVAPDFEAVYAKVRSEDPSLPLWVRLYPLWVTYVRDTQGRVHSPATFLRAYEVWLMKNHPEAVRFNVKHVLVQAVRNWRDLQDLRRLRRPGVELEPDWSTFDPF